MMTVSEIQRHLLEYFIGRFGGSFTTVLPTTDLRARYGFKPPDWMQLADALTGQPWMQQIGGRLIQNDMINLTTVEQVAALIDERIRQGAAAHRTFATESVAPKPKAAKKKTAKKKTAKSKAATKTAANKKIYKPSPKRKAARKGR